MQDVSLDASSQRELDSVQSSNSQCLATIASNETLSGATILRASYEPDHLNQTDPPTESSSAAVAENSEEALHLPPGSSKDLLYGIASDASVKPKHNGIPPQSHSSDEWARPTDEETMNWLDQQLAKQNSQESSEGFNTTNVSTPRPAILTPSLSVKEEPLRTFIFPRGNGEVIVHRGFGYFPRLPPPAVMDESLRCFPPLSNAAYDLTTYGIDPKIHARLSKKRSADISNFPVVPVVRTESSGVYRAIDANISEPPSKGRNVEKPSSREFCNKCQKRHIKQGAPVNLDARDTCRSMIPEWFPKDRFDRPWDAFIELMNKYLRTSQMIEGTEDNPEAQTTWQMEYHDPTPEWTTVGRYGGWWRCRIGPDESNPTVSDVERNCQVCHKRMKDRAKIPIKKTETLTEKKAMIEEWIAKYTKIGMVKDRAYVLARIKTEGY